MGRIASARAQALAAIAAVTCAGIGAKPGAQEPPALVFAWEAPAECPDQEGVVAEIERLTGRSATAGSEPALHVKAVVTRAKHGMAVAITSDGGGTALDRKLEVAGCKEAVDATALVVAMALDPGAAEPTSPDEQGSPDANGHGHEQGSPAKGDGHEQGSPAGAATGSQTGSLPAAGRQGKGLEIRGEARVSFAFDTSALPAPAPGIAGSLGVWLGDFRVDATGMVLAEQRRTLPGGGGGDVGLATGALGVWFAPVRMERLEAVFGAAIEGGAMWGHGFGVTGARSATTPWLAVLGGAGGSVSFARWVGAQLFAGVAVPIVRERFLLGDEDLFTPGPAALRLHAGIFFRAP